MPEWTIPQDDATWHELKARLDVILMVPFSSKSVESTKPHHAGYSFLEALALANSGGTLPLARSILDRRQRERLSEQDWHFVAATIRSFHQTHQPKPGRPYKLERTAAENAERKAAQIVARSQTEWRTQHKRKRVPAEQTQKFIVQVIKKVSNDFGVPESRIKPDNIRNLLKAGRI